MLARDFLNIFFYIKDLIPSKICFRLCILAGAENREGSNTGWNTGINNHSTHSTKR